MSKTSFFEKPKKTKTAFWIGAWALTFLLCFNTFLETFISSVNSEYYSKKDTKLTFSLLLAYFLAIQYGLCLGGKELTKHAKRLSFLLDKQNTHTATNSETNTLVSPPRKNIIYSGSLSFLLLSLIFSLVVAPFGQQVLTHFAMRSLLKNPEFDLKPDTEKTLADISSMFAFFFSFFTEGGTAIRLTLKLLVEQKYLSSKSCQIPPGNNFLIICPLGFIKQLGKIIGLVGTFNDVIPLSLAFFLLLRQKLWIIPAATFSTWLFFTLGWQSYSFQGKEAEENAGIPLTLYTKSDYESIPEKQNKKQLQSGKRITVHIANTIFILLPALAATFWLTFLIMSEGFEEGFSIKNTKAHYWFLAIAFSFLLTTFCTETISAIFKTDKAATRYFGKPEETDIEQDAARYSINA